MGKGDQRSRRGKIFAGTHGKTRPKRRRKKVVAAPPVPVVQEAAPKTPRKRKTPTPAPAPATPTPTT